jgi:peptidoglycan/LPS O-acetylase OafA/YrhL
LSNLRPENEPPLVTSKDREPVLDGVRGLAFLIVLFHHVVIFSGIDRGVRLDNLVYQLGDSAWFGVDLFFVLSGFLITGILYETKGSESYFHSFYGRRVLSVFPLYYGFLVLALVVFPHLLPPDSAQNMVNNQGWYWLYLSNVYVMLEGWQNPAHLGHFWSLAVEEQFYLLWPMAVWALDRRRLMWLAIACFLGALALRIVQPFGIDATGIYVLLPTRMDALAAGAFLALVIRGQRGMGVLGRWPLAVFVVCIALLLAHYLRYHDVGYSRPIERTLGYTVFAVACASLIALALSASPATWLRRTFSSKVLRFFGKYSYGLYIIHVPIVFFLGDFGFRARLMPRLWDSTLPGVVVFGVVTTLLSVAMALASYHLWEIRFLRLKKYLPYRSKTPRQTAVPALAVR